MKLLPYLFFCLCLLAGNTIVLAGANAPTAVTATEGSAFSREPNAKTMAKKKNKKSKKPTTNRLNKRMAILSVIFGSIALPLFLIELLIFAFLLWSLFVPWTVIFIFLPSLIVAALGLAFGGIALQYRQEQPDKYGGKGAAIAGFIISAVFLLAILIIMGWLFFSFI